MLPAIGYSVTRLPIPDYATDLVNALEIRDPRLGSLADESNLVSEFDLALVSVRADALIFGGSTPFAECDFDRLAESAECWGAESIGGRLDLCASAWQMAIDAPLEDLDQRLAEGCDRIENAIARLAPYDLYLEAFVRPQPSIDAAAIADLFYGVLRRTQCGWMLDISATMADARRFGGDPFEFVANVIPAAERVRIRHSVTSTEAEWDLFRHALRLGSDRLTAVFVSGETDKRQRSLEQTFNLVQRAVESIDSEHVCCGKGVSGVSC